MGIKETDTYVIKRPDEPAYRVLDHGKFEKDRNESLVTYSKDDVVDVVSNLINSNQLTKGHKIDKKSSIYVIYRFVYEEETMSGKTIKYAYRVKVSKAYYEDNKPYTDRLEALVKSSHAIRTVNKVKMLAIGVATTLVMSGAMVLINDAAEKEAEIRNQQTIEYVQQLNDERRENGMPPIGAAYEDGTPFQGSYQDWVKYISGYTDKDGNVIDSEESEPKTYQKSN